ncbi:MAG: PQQ-dependent dehydrogenase, methanol/ethanol family, partial [Burkholderiales bacterium]
MSFRLKMKHIPLALAALAAPGVASANDGLAKLIANPDNWAMQAGNFYNQRYSALSQINKSNVKNLQAVWTFSTGVLRGHEGGPLVIGDTLYVHSAFPNKVFAIDLETLKIKWKYEPKQDPSVIPVMCCDT